MGALQFGVYYSEMIINKIYRQPARRTSGPINLPSNERTQAKVFGDCHTYCTSLLVDLDNLDRRANASWVGAGAAESHEDFHRLRLDLGGASQPSNPYGSLEEPLPAMELENGLERLEDE